MEDQLSLGYLSTSYMELAIVGLLASLQKNPESLLPYLLSCIFFPTSRTRPSAWLSS